MPPDSRHQSKPAMNTHTRVHISVATTVRLVLWGSQGQLQMLKVLASCLLVHFIHMMVHRSLTWILPTLSGFCFSQAIFHLCFVFCISFLVSACCQCFRTQHKFCGKDDICWQMWSKLFMLQGVPKLSVFWKAQQSSNTAVRSKAEAFSVGDELACLHDKQPQLHTMLHICISTPESHFSYNGYLTKQAFKSLTIRLKVHEAAIQQPLFKALDRHTTGWSSIPEYRKVLGWITSSSWLKCKSHLTTGRTWNDCFHPLLSLHMFLRKSL